MSTNFKYALLALFLLIILPYGIGLIFLIGYFLYKKFYHRHAESNIQDVEISNDNASNIKVVKNNSARNKFFSGNYLKESANDSFGSARELEAIVPLTITYENNQKEVNTRHIEVFAISTADKRAFLLAFCHLKSASRVFSPYGIKHMIDKNGNEYSSIEEINSFFIDNVVPLLKNERNQKIVLNCFK